MFLVMSRSAKKPMQFMLITFWFFLSIASCQAQAPVISKAYDIRLIVSLLPDSGEAQITWSISNSKWLKLLDFNLSKLQLASIEGNGELIHEGKRLQWHLPQKDASLSYRVKLKHKRNAHAYDAWIEKNWALFRAEDIFPSVRIKKIKGSISTTYVKFEMPTSWTDVNIAWLPKEEQFWMPPSANVNLPKGWIIAGQLGTRHESLDGMRFTVSAPKGHEFRQMETLAFVTAIWPHFKSVFKPKGEKALIVGAAEPMWRGGLSGPESMFVHADRPLISENGTSTLVHELVHSLSDLKGAKGHDWITEGLAEYYSVAILFRAGFFTESRQGAILDGLREWAGSRHDDKIFTVANYASKAEDTARAVFVFHLLDLELKNADHDLDGLLDKVENNEGMTLDMLKTAFKTLVGKESKTLAKVQVVLGSASR